MSTPTGNNHDNNNGNGGNGDDNAWSPWVARLLSGDALRGAAILAKPQERADDNDDDNNNNNDDDAILCQRGETKLLCTPADAHALLTLSRDKLDGACRLLRLGAEHVFAVTTVRGRSVYARSLDDSERGVIVAETQLLLVVALYAASVADAPSVISSVEFVVDELIAAGC